MNSIRNRLILWLLGGCACAIAAVMYATYTYARAELRRVFDGELRQIARAVDMREDWRATGRVRMQRAGFDFAVRAYGTSGRMYFQSGQPMLPADVPQSTVEGYESLDTRDGRWRIYTHASPEGFVQVGQAVEARAALARELSLRVLVPLVLFVPVLALLIAWALRRGLAPLEETSRRVSAMDASRLAPLPVHSMPTELLPLVRQINALTERLSASLDAQRRFLAEAAHELRSPVTALALQAQLADRAQSPAARSAARSELLRGIDRTGRLVQQLLDLARLGPEVHCEPRTVDIAALVREVVGAHAAQADAAGVDLGAEAPEALHVAGSELELQSLLANLVDNAIRYAPRNSPVTVCAWRKDGSAEICVVDAGPGIPAQERARVFERFYRLDGDGTRGTGLGMAIVKTIVQRHGGSIVLEDAVPGAVMPGLSVRVSLPALVTGKRAVRTGPGEGAGAHGISPHHERDWPAPSRSR